VCLCVWGQVDLAFDQAWGRGRILRYGGNLFRHAGFVSSFGYRNDGQFRARHDKRRFGDLVSRCRCSPSLQRRPCSPNLQPW
jgi:hypothetical protein